MDVRQAMRIILERFPGSYYVSTCGHISRALYNLQDQPNNFYMVGSMGIAAPLALGMVLVRPQDRFVILDGDGSFLMNLGAAAMIAEWQPRNLVHVILDNRMHESTGGQRSVRVESFTRIAAAIGYRAALSIESGEQARTRIPETGPVLLHFLIEPRTAAPGKRVEWKPREIVERFTASWAPAVGAGR
jgi:sulfopyruvate decarboxylase subunit beta